MRVSIVGGPSGDIDRESDRESVLARSLPPRLFIAHAPEDRAFVEGFLVPSLRLPEREVLLSSALTLGEPLIEELARGAHSTVTVLVLSPAFFACAWTRFAEQLAQHRDVEREEEREDSAIIPLLLASCDVPLVSRFRVSLDFRDTDRAHWDAQVARLRARLDATAAPIARLPRGTGPAALLLPDATPCPYPGMRSFTAEEVAAFHGRRAEIEELLARLRAGERELYVIGPSGSGKSSLVFAGLVPSLRQTPSPVGGRFAVRTMRPGVDPLAALAFCRAAVAGAGAEEGCDRELLIIDQLEELFTIAPPPARAAFFAAIRALRAEPQLTLIFTMRADFYGALMDCPWWTDLEGRLSRIDVGPLRGASLRTAIEAPAAAASVFFEPALLERLLDDAADEPGTLPLLQETLVVLWQQRAKNLLRLADYSAIGSGDHTGLAVTLARRADSALRALPLPRRLIARRIFLRLVQFGSGRADTRRQQPRQELHSAATDPAEVDAVLAHLVEHRLITASEAHGPGAVFDLSHEILLSAWPTLREWIAAQRVDEQRRRMLETKADEWKRGGGGMSGLLDHTQLVELDRWLVASHAARDVHLSQSALALVARSRRRRVVLRWFALAAFVLLSLGTVTIGVLLYFARDSIRDAQRKSWEATEQRKRANELLAQSYQEAGRKLLVEDNRPLQALPYLLAASGLSDNAALRMLFYAASQNAPLSEPLSHHGSAITAAQLSADGNRLLTSSADGVARLWDTVRGTPLSPRLVHERGVAINAVALAPDGKRLATAGEDGLVRLWDADAARAVGAPLRASDRSSPVTAARFSPDGALLLTASKDGAARLWDAESRELLHTFRHRDWIRAIAFSPDGQRVLTASHDHTAQLWNVESGEKVGAAMVHEGGVRDAAFSPDGQRVVTAGDDHTARLWNATSGAQLGTPLEHEGIVERAAFSPDGKRVVTASWDHTARVWSVESGQMIGPPLRHQSNVWSAAFSRDGQRVITASDDNTARIWDAQSGALTQPPLEHQAPVHIALFRGDDRAVTASDDGTARLWNAAASRQPCPALEHDAAVVRAAFSHDGARLVTLSDGGALRAWDPATCAPLELDEDRDSLLVATGPDSERKALLSPDRQRRLERGDKRLVVVDAATSRPLTPPIEHPALIRCAAFSPDSGRLVTASDDNTARVWDATSGQPLTPPLLHHGGPVRFAAFSPDGARLVTTSADGTARLWDVSLYAGGVVDWRKLAERSPYQLVRGVLVLRAIRDAPATPAAEAPAGSL